MVVSTENLHRPPGDDVERGARVTAPEDPASLGEIALAHPGGEHGPFGGVQRLEQRNFGQQRFLGRHGVASWTPLFCHGSASALRGIERPEPGRGRTGLRAGEKRRLRA